jgi:hypothetical protein
MDSRGNYHQDIVRGSARIPFPHRKVAPAQVLDLKMPDERMLCVLLLTARTDDGLTVAQNFVHYLVSAEYPPEHEPTARALVLRGKPGGWSQAVWSRGGVDRGNQGADDACHGSGHGFFEWLLPLQGADLSKARRLKLLCEISSHRADNPQTDDEVFPTTLQMFLNDVCVYEGVIRNHPHDSRGVLSYLRGGVGAYGYLTHAFAENELLRQIVNKGAKDFLALRFVVPDHALARGGLTVYGAECGRFPVCPTVIIDW